MVYSSKCLCYLHNSVLNLVESFKKKVMVLQKSCIPLFSVFLFSAFEKDTYSRKDHALNDFDYLLVSLEFIFITMTCHVLTASN